MCSKKSANLFWYIQQVDSGNPYKIGNDIFFLYKKTHFPSNNLTKNLSAKKPRPSLAFSTEKNIWSKTSKTVLNEKPASTSMDAPRYWCSPPIFPLWFLHPIRIHGDTNGLLAVRSNFFWGEGGKHNVREAEAANKIF